MPTTLRVDPRGNQLLSRLERKSRIASRLSAIDILLMHEISKLAASEMQEERAIQSPENAPSCFRFQQSLLSSLFVGERIGAVKNIKNNRGVRSIVLN